LSAPNRPPRACDRPATTERLIACGQCRLTYRSTALRKLELVEVLDSNCVRQVLSDWPSGHSIEVRRCKRCGGEIARESGRVKPRLRVGRTGDSRAVKVRETARATKT
jgi:hypothetical protein